MLRPSHYIYPLHLSTSPTDLHFTTPYQYSTQHEGEVGVVEDSSEHGAIFIEELYEHFTNHAERVKPGKPGQPGS